MSRRQGAGSARVRGTIGFAVIMLLGVMLVEAGVTGAVTGAATTTDEPAADVARAGTGRILRGGGLLLDSVAGQCRGCKIMVDEEIRFYVRLTNDIGAAIQGFNNGFRVYSPDGAQWQPVVLDTVSHGWPDAFEMGFFIGYYGADGSGADTAYCGAISITGGGLPDGFDGRVWWLETLVASSEAGKHLCLDSCFFPPAGEWLWVSGATSYYPAWDGPHCFLLVTECRNDVPALTNGVDSLPGNHCDSMQYDFEAEDLDCDSIEFELVSGPGAIDGASGQWSYDPLPSDVGTSLAIEVRACDDSGCGTAQVTHLIVTNEAPVFISGCGDTVATAPEAPAVHGFEADSIDCGAMHLSVEDVTPAPHGLWLINAGALEVVFTPETEDVGLFAFTVRIADDLGAYSECQYYVNVSCCDGIRGNVDSDPEDGIDISDLVFLVDYMFTGGPAPECVPEANMDGSDALGDGEHLSDIDISDLVYLVDYMFSQGPAPADCP